MPCQLLHCLFKVQRQAKWISEAYDARTYSNSCQTRPNITLVMYKMKIGAGVAAVPDGAGRRERAAIVLVRNPARFARKFHAVTILIKSRGIAEL